MARNIFRILRLIRWAFIAVVLLAMLFRPKVQTISTDFTPGLNAHRYDVPLSMATTFASQFATRKLGWHLVSTDTESGLVVLKTSRFFGTQTDEISVQCKQTDDPRYVTVAITSHGNFAQSDHIRALQAGMDDKLPSPQ